MPFPPLFAWPDKLDLFATITFVAIAVTLPSLGYMYMVADFRAYLKTLNRMLVRVRDYLPHIPAWARHETPRSLRLFGLKMPCTEADLLHAYRTRVKRLHPDRGGDKQKFLILQTHFEAALGFLQDLETVRAKGR